MTDATNSIEEKSLENMAFVHWLRTGQSLSVDEMQALQERKYNHNHDELGRFASSGGGAGSHSAVYHAAPPRSSATGPKSQAHSTQARAPARPIAKQPHSALQAEGYTPWTQVGSHPARVYRTKAGAAIIDPHSGMPMLVPQGVSIQNTIRSARIFSSPLNRAPAASSAFEKGGPMDFQRTHSTLRSSNGGTIIDQRFIAIGNYNYGVYAAASGMSLMYALQNAAAIYVSHTWRPGEGAYYGSSKNSQLIVSGYRDYISNNIGE